MDFKNRFQTNRPQQSNNQRNNSFDNKLRPTHNSFGRQAGPSRQSSGGVLNKFKRKTVAAGNAPQGQFKKYMLQANNVFYQNRPEKRRLQQINRLKWFLIYFWTVLASSYFLINRIQPFQGECPPQARCGVFVHCPQFFDYDEKSNTCVLSSNMLLQIKSVSESQINNLQYVYGDTDCSQHKQIPSLDLRNQFPEIEDQNKRRHYQASSKLFFSNIENQKEYGFKLQGDIITPTTKRYTIACRLQLFLSDPHRQLDITYFIAGIVLFVIVFIWYYEKRRINKMYEFLREKVIAAPDQILNVTHTMTDLEAIFGMIEQKTWQKINEVRASYKEIGFYEDDFLYWKKM